MLKGNKEIHRSEGFVIVARSDGTGSGCVEFRVRTHAQAASDQRYSVAQFYGYINPNPGNHWGRKRQNSIAEAMHEALRWVHKREADLRTAEAEIEAARDVMRAMADLDSEMAG